MNENKSEYRKCVTFSKEKKEKKIESIKEG